MSKTHPLHSNCKGNNNNNNNNNKNNNNENLPTHTLTTCLCCVAGDAVGNLARRIRSTMPRYLNLNLAILSSFSNSVLIEEVRRRGEGEEGERGGGDGEGEGEGVEGEQGWRGREGGGGPVKEEKWRPLVYIPGRSVSISPSSSAILTE